MAPGIEAFVSYIPMDRRQALADGATLGHRASGAVLFADISGFTPLTALLYTELGPQRGAEELDRILNQVFEALIGRIHHYRGSVTGFSGDAITCWFDGDNGLWATACALEMQEVMAQIGAIKLPGVSALPLAIKATVTSGRVRRLVVGDPEVQRLDVVAGDAVDRASAAEKLAASGEVLLGPEVSAFLDGRLLVNGVREDEAHSGYAVVAGLSSPVAGRPWLKLPENDLDQTQLQSWLLPAVYDLLNTGHGQFLAELRNTVALFLKFGGLDYDKDLAVGDKLDRYIRWVQGIVDHYGGSLINLTIGDKGSYLLAAFGAPVAHEDDARRAVSAALDLVALPEDLAFLDNVRIGISQGIMFSGAYGGSTRRTYGILGEETNIAARLMEKAEAGQILVSSRIAEATRQSHRFEELDPVTVKGIAEPIQVCQLLDRRHSSMKSAVARGDTEMVGRSDERHLLGEQLQTLQDGQDGGVIIVEGEAGIGKSRLLEELLQQADGLEITAYLGAADAIEKNAVYFAWRAVFWDLFQLDTVEDAELPGAGRLSPGQRERVMAHLKTAVPDKLQLAPLLNAVLPIDLPDNELTAQMTGEVRAGNTQDLLTALLNVHAQSAPPLLILEDAHWLDSASWALTRLVSREVEPMLLVIATRPLPDPLPTEYAALLGRITTHHLILATLPPEEVLQLVCLRLGVDALPEPVNELLLEKASGHPFFSEELAYALRDTGMITIENGKSRLAVSVDELKALSFPDSVDSVITSRIDLLTAQQQLTLKVASVIGRVFAYRTLFDIHPIQADKPKIYDQLNMLERLDITPLETPEPELSYIFKHIITREVAYNLMSFAQRQGLHQAIAEWLERTYADDLTPYYPLLAYHWQKALGDQYDRSDLGAKALEYLEKAAEQALRNFANREAVDFFGELLYLDERLGNPAGSLRRARWQRGLGDANLRLGNWQDTREQMEAALALLNHPISSNTTVLVAKIGTQMAKQIAYRLQSPYPTSGTTMSEQKREIVYETAHAFRGLTETYWFREEQLLIVYASLRNANLGQYFGISPELGEAFANVGLTLGVISMHRQARAYTRWALEIVDQIEDLSAKAYIIQIASIYLTYVGSWPKAEELCEKGVQFSLEIDDRRMLDQFGSLLALMTYYRGRFRESLHYWNEVYPSANRRNHAQPQLWGLLGQAEIELWQSNNYEKVMRLTAAVEDLPDAKNLGRGDRIRMYGVQAKAHLQAGNYQHAYDVARNVLDQTKQTKLFIPYSFEGYAAPPYVFLELIEIAHEQTDIDRQAVADLARQSIRFVHKIARSYPIFQPRALNYQGHYEWISGKTGKARETWRKSINMAKRYEMPGEEGLTCYEYGRHLPPDDPDREKYLQRAIELFSKVEAAYYLNLAQAEM